MKLKPNEKLILLYIKQCNKCFIGTRELTQQLNIDISQVRRYLKHMEELKIIHILKRSNRWEVIK